MTAPTAGADVCRRGRRRHFSVNGCDQYANTGAEGSPSIRPFVPYVGGEAPCYTMEGIPTSRLRAIPADPLGQRAKSH